MHKTDAKIPISYYHVISEEHVNKQNTSNHISHKLTVYIALQKVRSGTKATISSSSVSVTLKIVLVINFNVANKCHCRP